MTTSDLAVATSIAVRLEELRRRVVAIDPAVSATEESDDTGIIAVARGPCQPSTCKLAPLLVGDKVSRCPGHGYVLGDYTCHESPAGWAKIALGAYDEWDADWIVAEVNNGGDMVGTTIHAVRAGVPYEAVRATRGKLLRAEPLSALYEQGRMHHLGTFPELEQQMETFTDDSDWSPDRLDALVWGCVKLGLILGQGDAFLQTWKAEIARKAQAQEVPAELASMPKQASNLPSQLRPGCQHRFQRWPNGVQCVNCGGWRQ